MNQDTLIQALMNHLDPDAVLEAKRNGTMFSYYVTLAQNILGNNAQNQTPRKQPTTRQPVRQVAVDLNEQEGNTNETEQPAREADVPAPARKPATARQPARAARAEGDRVGIRQL